MSVRDNMMINVDIIDNGSKDVNLDSAEDERDLALYKKALADYCKNPKTYTVEEIEKEVLENR